MRILFTSSLSTSFIREDLALLRKHVHVDHVVTRGISALWKIPAGWISARASFTWFASVYAFWVVAWGKILSRRTIVVVGGVDASREPGIGYGIWLSPWKAPLVGWAMRHAWKLLPVDPFFVGQIRSLARYDGGNIEVVPTGYDADRWTPGGPRDVMVLCVAVCHDAARMKKKGIGLLAEAARLLPDVRFVVVGVNPGAVAESGIDIPANMRLLPPVGQEELLAWYRRAKVYCQPSYTEGLPNSLCEAMLCGCAPVGTRVGGIPSAIADAGWLVPYGEPDRLAEALRAALQADAEIAHRARGRIAGTFPLRRREEALLRILREADA